MARTPESFLDQAKARLQEARASLSSAKSAKYQLQRRHEEEMNSAQSVISEAESALGEERRRIFAEVLDLNGLSQCSICLGEEDKNELKVVLSTPAKKDPEHPAWQSCLDTPDWDLRGVTTILRVCRECMEQREKTSEREHWFVNANWTNRFYCWIPVREIEGVVEAFYDGAWSVIPADKLTSSYFKYYTQVTIVRSVAKRLDLDLGPGSRVEPAVTKREEYLEELAERRRKQEEIARRSRYCSRCGVFHDGRCPDAPPVLIGSSS